MTIKNKNTKNNPHIGQSLKSVILEEKSKNNKFVQLYQDEELINEVVNQLIKSRKEKGITQTQLAKITNTTQPLIARLEGRKDSRIPSLKLLSKLANGLGKRLKITFEDADILHST